MKVEDLMIYMISLEISNEIWKMVLKWDYFARSTVGKQLVRAADSVPANISEGFGRYHYKEEKQFLYYARGSLEETRTFISMAYSRDLIDKEMYASLVSQMDLLGRKLNSFINAIGKSGTKK